MSDAQALNNEIRVHAPAAAALLSALGRRIWFPSGVPAQAADARDCPINATIGQLTDGRKRSVPLPVLARHTGALPNEEVYFYAPQGGRRDLRQAWRTRILSRAATNASLPVVTNGLTHGLSLVGDLFIEDGTDVLLPVPCWGNYRLIFETRCGGRLRPYPVIDGDGFHLEGLRSAIQACTRPAVLVLNLPSNPVGYSPTLAEADALVEMIEQSPVPLVVLCDDAYHGMVWEDGLLPHSLFHRLSQCDPSRVLAVKIDGATKEMFFFGGRVGFVTFGVEGPAAAALENKMLGLARSSISTAPTSSQSLVMRALTSPDTAAQTDEILADIRGRYQSLKAGLDQHGVPYLPFNSAFFALIKVQRPPHEVRRALLADGVGVVAAPDAGAVRVSYASVAREDIDTLVAALARHAR
jgi:aspartate/methionine/tyrosine aminotransferase